MPRRARATRQLQPNRADLTRPTSSTVPNQTYGEAAQQRAAQQAIPMGQPPIAGGTAPPPSPSGPPQQPQLQDVLAAAQAHNGPGDRPFTRPTERPNEPVTSGLPMGPGPGPESLQGVGAAARQNVIEQGTLSHLLTSMASQPNSTSAIRDLAARAQTGVM